MRFTVRRALLAAAARAALSPLAVQAQAFPDRPIRLLIPYAAGGSTDNMARVLQEPLQKALGQPVIIENKAGASGVIAAREVIRSKPDGYTLFFVNNGNLAVTPAVVKDANYDGITAEFFADLPPKVVNTRLVRVREAVEWRKRGGTVIEIKRIGYGPASEWERDCLQELREAGCIDTTIVNDGTIEELHGQVRSLVRCEAQALEAR
jgi:hypothetical protein